MLYNIDLFKKHLEIALIAHKGQKTPFGLPYSYHILSVAGEVINVIVDEGLSVEEANVSIACALLHDVIEDTDLNLSDYEIDPLILTGVFALTKDITLLKKEQMKDSLEKLSFLPLYIQMVKLADRITNLDTPPKHWTKEKIDYYLEEAILINKTLKSPKGILNKLLEEKINNYRKYVE